MYARGPVFGPSAAWRASNSSSIRPAAPVIRMTRSLSVGLDVVVMPGISTAKYGRMQHKNSATLALHYGSACRYEGYVEKKMTRVQKNLWLMPDVRDALDDLVKRLNRRSRLTTGPSEITEIALRQFLARGDDHAFRALKRFWLDHGDAGAIATVAEIEREAPRPGDSTGAIADEQSAAQSLPPESSHIPVRRRRSKDV